MRIGLGEGDVKLQEFVQPQGGPIYVPSDSTVSGSITPAMMSAPLPVLTPDNIVQPFPNLSTQLATSPPSDNTSFWCSLNQWIADNPVLAAAILLASAAALWRGK